MEINGKVHCFFEQSGTFKNEFKKLGYEAFDYDIQDNFGETDYVKDLFAEIENAYSVGVESIFDNITKDDLIMAFFPCIEFSCVAQMWYSLNQRDYEKWSYKKRIDYIIEKNNSRANMFNLLNKMCGVCLDRGFRLIFENPYGINTYLKTTVFLKKPSVIDNNRTLRGDYMIKPTAYCFFNCEPTNGFSFQPKNKSEIKHVMKMRKGKRKGLCSEERSMISPDYARNFICDFILGKEQKNSQLTLF